MYYVYLLKGNKKGWHYVGYTENLDRRLMEHKNGSSPSTKPYRPLGLIFYEAYKSRLDTERREEYFKTNQGKRALKIMLKESLE